MLLSGCVPGPSTALAVEQVAGRALVRTVLFQFTGNFKVGCPVDQSLFKLKHGRDFKLNAPTKPP